MKDRFLGPLSQVEGNDQQILRRQPARAADVARGGGKIRTGLINASRKMIKSRDFSKKAIAGLVQEKCDKVLTGLTAEILA